MAHTFDLNEAAQRLAEAHEEPTITIGDKLYRGRLLSIEQWLPFYERLVKLEEDIGKGKGDLRSFTILWVQYLYMVFPRKSFWSWAPDPVAAIREMPGDALKDAFTRFFFHQASVLGMASELQPTTPTIDLPDRTSDTKERSVA